MAAVGRGGSAFETGLFHRQSAAQELQANRLGLAIDRRGGDRMKVRMSAPAVVYSAKRPCCAKRRANEG